MTGAGPPPPPVIDPIAAHGLLVDVLGQGVGPLEPVGVGEWSRCVGFTGPDGRELVLRVGRHPADFACDAHVAAHRSAALPVPAVVARGEGMGAHWAVCERVRGTFLEDLDADRWQAVLPSLLRTLDAVRGLPRPDGGGFGPWEGRGHGTHPSWRSWVLAVADDPPGGRIHGWRAALDAHPAAARDFRRGLERLREVADAGEGHRCAVHGDLLHGNVLVQDGQVSGVIDWGAALDGDPVQEVAELELWAPWHAGLDAASLGPRLTRHLRAVGVVDDDLEARLEAGMLRTALAAMGYCALAGRDGDALDLARIRRRIRPLLG